MAVADEWNKVDEAFNGLERYRVLHPTLAAMAATGTFDLDALAS